MAHMGQPLNQDDWEQELLEENKHLRARVAELEARALEVIEGGPVDLDLDSAEDAANYIYSGSL
jgi:hypothetical protein